MLVQLGRWCFRNRGKALLLWILVAAVIIGAGQAVDTESDSSQDFPGSESRDGFDALEEYFDGEGSGLSGTIVFASSGGVDDPAVRGSMETMFVASAEIDGVSIISPYSEEGAQQVNPDRTVAFATVNLAPEIDEVQSSEIGSEIGELVPEQEDLEVEIGGVALAEFEPPESELIGLAFAVVVLIIAFGSVLAMGLPIGTALFGVGTGLGTGLLLSAVITMPDFASILAAMIGLGVGIDYALFIVTRYRELLHQGASCEEATVTALDSSGRAVIFAGMTVVISLMGLLLIGLPFVSGLAIAAAVTVLCTMIASITLLPALLGFAGDRIEVTRWRGLIAAGLVAVALLGVGTGFAPLLWAAPAAAAVLIAGLFVGPLKREVPRRPPKPREQTWAYRWSRVIQSKPWPAAIGGTAILLLLTAPVLDLRLGFSDEGNYAEETTTRQAYDILSDGFGPGFNGPLLVTIELGSGSDEEGVQVVSAAIAADPGIAAVTPAFPNDPAAPEAFVIRAIPTTAPQEEATDDTVVRLRDEVIPGAVQGTALEVNVTGNVAAGVDFTEYLSSRMPLFFAAVLTLSFLLLMVVFRSLLVPLKAVIMNLLSIGGAYGIVVAMFQWGWFGDTLGFSGAPIEPFIPMMLFAIVFGLSMDYEVFLLSRIKEEYDRSGDAQTSVADGLAATARVITAAAAIMVVVFGSFMFEEDRVVRLFGMGLAVAVLLDATLVRMLLVPATMELLGSRNWWIPGWLDRILPKIDIEGHHGEFEADDTGTDDTEPPSAELDPEPEPTLVG